MNRFSSSSCPKRRAKSSATRPTELAFNGQRGTPDKLREKAATVQNKKSPVAIKIDKGTTYERIAVILDILQVQKLYNIQLINKMEKE